MDTTISGVGKHVPRKIIVGLVMTFAVVLQQYNAAALDVIHGSGDDFAILPGSSRTSISDFAPNTLATSHLNGVAPQTQHDVITALNQATGFMPTHIHPEHNPGGLTLTPGIYFFSASSRHGQTTHHEEGNSGGMADSSFSSGAGITGQAGGSATPGSGAGFADKLKTKPSLIVTTGPVSESPSPLGINLGNNFTPKPADISSVPDASSTLPLLGAAFASILAFRRRFSSLV